MTQLREKSRFNRLHTHTSGMHVWYFHLHVCLCSLYVRRKHKTHLFFTRLKRKMKTVSAMWAFVYVLDVSKDECLCVRAREFYRGSVYTTVLYLVMPWRCPLMHLQVSVYKWKKGRKLKTLRLWQWGNVWACHVKLWQYECLY